MQHVSDSFFKSGQAQDLDWGQLGRLEDDMRCGMRNISITKEALLTWSAGAACIQYYSRSILVNRTLDPTFFNGGEGGKLR